MQPDRTLRQAWLSTLEDLNLSADADMLITGPYAEFLADQMPGPTGATTREVATLRVAEVPEGATPDATGFPDGMFDAAVVMSAWDGPAGVEGAVREAVRTVRSGGTIWIGEIDAKALTESMPAAHLYGLLYRSSEEAAADVRFRFRAADTIGVEAVRARMHSVDETKVDLPIISIDTAAEGVEAVRAGIWPGTERLDDVSLDWLLGQVDASLRPPTRFPVVLTLPWLLIRGTRP